MMQSNFEMNIWNHVVVCIYASAIWPLEKKKKPKLIVKL